MKEQVSFFPPEAGASAETREVLLRKVMPYCSRLADEESVGDGVLAWFSQTRRGNDRLLGSPEPGCLFWTDLRRAKEGVIGPGGMREG